MPVNPDDLRPVEDALGQLGQEYTKLNKQVEELEEAQRKGGETAVTAEQNLLKAVTQVQNAWMAYQRLTREASDAQLQAYGQSLGSLILQERTVHNLYGAHQALAGAAQKSNTAGAAGASQAARAVAESALALRQIQVAMNLGATSHPDPWTPEADAARKKRDEDLRDLQARREATGRAPLSTVESPDAELARKAAAVDATEALAAAMGEARTAAEAMAAATEARAPLKLLTDEAEAARLVAEGYQEMEEALRNIGEYGSPYGLAHEPKEAPIPLAPEAPSPRLAETVGVEAATIGASKARAADDEAAGALATIREGLVEAMKSAQELNLVIGEGGPEAWARNAAAFMAGRRQNDVQAAVERARSQRGTATGGGPPKAPPSSKGGSSFGGRRMALRGLHAVTSAFHQAEAAIKGWAAAASPVAADTLSQSFTLLSAKIGQSFVPYIVQAAAYVQDAAHWWESLSESTKNLTARLAIVGTILLGIGAAFAKIAIMAIQLTPVFMGIGNIAVKAFGLAAQAVGSFVAAWQAGNVAAIATPLGIVLLAVVAVAAAFALFASKIGDASQQMDLFEAVTKKLKGGGGLTNRDLGVFSSTEQKDLAKASKVSSEALKQKASDIAGKYEDKAKYIAPDEDLAAKAAALRAELQKQDERATFYRNPFGKRKKALREAGVAEEDMPTFHDLSGKLGAEGIEKMVRLITKPLSEAEARGAAAREIQKTGKLPGRDVSLAADKSIKPEFTAIEGVREALQMRILQGSDLQRDLLETTRQGNRVASEERQKIIDNTTSPDKKGAGR